MKCLVSVTIMCRVLMVSRVYAVVYSPHVLHISQSMLRIRRFHSLFTPSDVTSHNIVITTSMNGTHRRVMPHLAKVWTCSVFGSSESLLKYLDISLSQPMEGVIQLQRVLP